MALDYHTGTVAGVFEVVYSTQARRRLRRMPGNLARTILGKIDTLAADPTAPNVNATALKGGEGFRLRVGDWRVLYTVHPGEKLLRVAAILPRGEAYR